MLTIKMAFRNLFRHKRRTILTASSMIVGFILGSFFIGWADGTYNYIIDTFTRNRLGHIQIHRKGYLDQPTLYKTLEDLQSIENLLEKKKKIESWTPRVFSAGLVSVAEESAGAQIIGVHPQKEKNTTDFDQKVIQGDYFSTQPSREALLGKGLADLLNAQVGEDIIIVSQAADGSIANDRYTIKGLLDMGNEAANRSSFYLHIKDTQKLLVLDQKVHEIALTLKSLHDVKPMTETLQNEIQNPLISVEPWQEFAHTFYMAMKADKEGMWISLIVVILVVAIGVLNTVLMSVLERRREYGVLKALGTKPAQVFRLVLTEVILMTLICIVIGAGVGFGVNSYFAEQGISLGQPLTWGGMEIEVMKGEINLRSFVIPAVTILLTAAAVSTFPALHAARTEPARTMRMF